MGSTQSCAGRGADRACTGRIAAFLIILACMPLPAQVTLGSLEIHSEPGTELHWEGTYLDITNEDGIVEVAGIPPGDYSIEMTKRGFSPTAGQIEIRAGERAVLEVPLQAEPAESQEVTEPATAGGAAAGSTILPPYLLIAGLAAVALIALVLYVRRDRLEFPTLEPPAPPRPKVRRIPRPDSSPGFLNDLKTRERDLERFVIERRKEPRVPIEIIDVEVTEVMEVTEVTETVQEDRR